MVLLLWFLFSLLVLGGHLLGKKLLFVLCLFVILVIPHLGFEGGTLDLNASVPGYCLPLIGHSDTLSICSPDYDIRVASIWFEDAAKMSYCGWLTEECIGDQQIMLGTFPLKQKIYSHPLNL